MFDCPRRGHRRNTTRSRFDSMAPTSWKKAEARIENMTKKQIGGGAAAVIAAGAIGLLSNQSEPQFDHSKWGGFAPATQQSTVQWKDGTNSIECLFEYDPDLTVTNYLMVTNEANVSRIVYVEERGAIVERQVLEKVPIVQ